MKDIAPLAQVKPEIMSAVNEQKLLASYAQYRNISPDIIKTEEEVSEMSRAAQEQNQQQQAVAAAPQIGGAMKDIAQAKQLDPEGVGQLLNI